MFVCFVLPGRSAIDPPNKRDLRIPPLLNPDSNSVDRYDSVMPNHMKFLVLYSNSKAYAAYLIKYAIVAGP